MSNTQNEFLLDLKEQAMNFKFRSACYPSFNFLLCCASRLLCVHAWVQDTPLYHGWAFVHRGIRAFLHGLKSQLHAFLALCDTVGPCVHPAVALCVYRIIES